MQNIPGLSFFDGLTRSRANPATPNAARSASATSPPETPLRDAAPFASLRSHSHPLGGSEGGVDNAREPFDDPLSPSGTSLPAASFSRRAASVSAATSPIPGLPTRRTSGTSTTTRSSILSKDSIFSSPILNRRPSSIAENSAESSSSTPATGGRERSSSLLGKENNEPTAKDVTLMAVGTQAYAMLKRIQEHPIELADIIRLLVTKKAILILPTYPASTEDPAPQRAYYEDHVIIPESNSGESLFVTLSGIRGILKPASSSIALLGLATGQDFGTMVSDASGPTKRSFFDNISKSEGATSTDHTLELVNSSRRPVVIFVESVGSIHALLVNKMIPRPEGEEVPTPIVPLASGIQSVRDRSAARRTASSASSVRSMSFAEEKEKDATPLPKLPKIGSDVPLEWDNMIRDLESMVIKLRKSPLPSADRYANEFQRKYDEVRHRFEAYGSASGLSNRWTEQDFDEVQQWVEAWLCREMYSVIFPQSADGPNSQDYLQDEQLQAKIAALNFLDLTLEHLGFVLEHPEDVAHIAQVVREGGVEMQKLALVKSPTDKMNVILSSHRVVVDALNREPAVQEMLAEADQTAGTPAAATTTTSETAETGSITSPTATAASSSPATSSATFENKPLSSSSTKSKRLSMPRIMMDGDIPRINSPLSPGVRQPKIPMDEGFERRSQADDDDSVIRPASASETAVTTETAVMTDSANAEQKKDDTAAESDKEATTSTTEVNPANIELPASPTPTESASTLSVIVHESVEATTAPAKEESAATEAAVPELPSSRKHYSADVLLPLLIFSVVKSNPPMLISNLRYIQRFRVQDHLTGELAYCLTNMMAVVSFLETLDPQAFGLSSDIRVLSDLSDIHTASGKPNPAVTPLLNFQEGLDHTKALGQKVSQELVGAAEEGLKVISDVVQDGYSKFFGRFLTTADGTTPFGVGSPRIAAQTTRGTRSMSAASSLAATAAAAATAAVSAANPLEEERKRRAAAVTGAMANAGTGTGGSDEKSRLSGLVSPAGVTSNVTAVSVDGSAGTTGVDKSSPHDSAMEAAARNRVLEFLRTAEGPRIQFMACTDSGDLRLSDIKDLLEDYQRIGKMLDQAKKLA